MGCRNLNVSIYLVFGNSAAGTESSCAPLWDASSGAYYCIRAVAACSSSNARSCLDNTGGWEHLVRSSGRAVAHSGTTGYTECIGGIEAAEEGSIGGKGGRAAGGLWQSWA